MWKYRLGMASYQHVGGRMLTVHFINGEQKTLPTARRPAALLTLSRQQD
jgi:hypothetical protein